MVNVTGMRLPCLCICRITVAEDVSSPMDGSVTEDLPNVCGLGVEELSEIVEHCCARLLYRTDVCYL